MRSQLAGRGEGGIPITFAENEQKPAKKRISKKARSSLRPPLCTTGLAKQAANLSRFRGIWEGFAYALCARKRSVRARNPSSSAFVLARPFLKQAGACTRQLRRPLPLDRSSDRAMSASELSPVDTTTTRFHSGSIMANASGASAYPIREGARRGRARRHIFRPPKIVSGSVPYAMVRMPLPAPCTKAKAAATPPNKQMTHASIWCVMQASRLGTSGWKRPKTLVSRTWAGPISHPGERGLRRRGRVDDPRLDGRPTQKAPGRSMSRCLRAARP